MKKISLLLITLMLAFCAKAENRNASINVDSSINDTDTDIAQLDNTIYLLKEEVAAGSTLTLSVRMKNNYEVTGYQFDMYLPDGISFATDEEGEPLCELSTKRTTHQRTNFFNSKMQSDGALRVLCSSTTCLPFNGNDGEVATIGIKVDSSVADGEYPIILKKVEVTDKTGFKRVQVSYLKSTLKVTSAIRGDVNNDGKLSINDVVGIIRILRGENSGLNTEAADYDNNGKIDKADADKLAEKLTK